MIEIPREVIVGVVAVGLIEEVDSVLEYRALTGFDHI